MISALLGASLVAFTLPPPTIRRVSVPRQPSMTLEIPLPSVSLNNGSESRDTGGDFSTSASRTIEDSRGWAPPSFAPPELPTSLFELRGTGRTGRQGDVGLPPRTCHASPRLTVKPRLARAKGWHAVEVTQEGRGHTFGVQIEVEDLDRSKKHYLQTNAGQPPLWLGPGRYRLLTQASRFGFPQEVRYEIVDALTNRILQVIPKSHVALNNVELHQGQRLRVVVLPAVRPYNAVFYELHGAPVAHLFARPYPSFEVGVGEYSGAEQFPNAPMAIAFWGGKRARERPELASQIRNAGVPIPGGDRIHDPVAVLGVRQAAADLAATFVRDRSEHGEDYRGNHHVTFLLRRDEGGCVPDALSRMGERALAREFERRILWMIHHNVHRPNEGGGYAGKTFLEDLREAEGRLSAWIETSRATTDLQRERVTVHERNVQMRGLDAISFASGSTVVTSRDRLKDALVQLVRAAHRERQNYLTYDPSSLQPLEKQWGESAGARATQLQSLIEGALQRLAQIAPGEAEEVARASAEH